jgi:hypothetical protein
LSDNFQKLLNILTGTSKKTVGISSQFHVDILKKLEKFKDFAITGLKGQLAS